MATIFAQPYYTGQPLGTLTFYLTGTLTLATVYSDEAATVPLPNPVTADAQGRFPVIYLGSGTEYRCIERDAAAVIIKDIDPVNPPYPIGGGTVTGDITATGKISAQTPNVGTTGGFQLRANSVSAFAYFQVQASDGIAEWGNWRYDSTGVARWSGAGGLSVSGPAVIAGAFQSGAATFSGRARTTPVAVTVGATTTIDASASNAFTMLMTTNVTTLTVNNAAEGHAISILFTQDGTGSRTIAWPASFRWAGGSAPTLSTAASARDYLSAQFIGGVWIAALAKGMA